MSTQIPEGITNPPIDELLARVDSKYRLVLFAAKRARQINAYYSQLGEGLLENVGPLVDTGVLGLGLWVDGRAYFDYHHSPADTLDKVDPTALADGVAAIAAIAYALAEVEPALVPAPAAAAAP